jgi:hypothetical protein
MVNFDNSMLSPVHTLVLDIGDDASKKTMSDLTGRRAEQLGRIDAQTNQVNKVICCL